MHVMSRRTCLKPSWACIMKEKIKLSSDPRQAFILGKGIGSFRTINLNSMAARDFSVQQWPCLATQVYQNSRPDWWVPKRLGEWIHGKLRWRVQGLGIRLNTIRYERQIKPSTKFDLWIYLPLLATSFKNYRKYSWTSTKTWTCTTIKLGHNTHTSTSSTHHNESVHIESLRQQCSTFWTSECDNRKRKVNGVDIAVLTMSPGWLTTAQRRH